MADWSTIRTTLGTWINTITGLPVYWARRPRSMRFSDTGYVILDITTRRTLGLRDDLQYEYDDTKPNGEQIRYYQSGQRVFTLTVQVRTDRNSDDLDALHYTSLIRDSLRLPIKTTTVLDAADIAVNAILQEIELSELQDGREKSVAQIDISFNATAITEDTSTTYVESLDDADLEIPEGSVVWTGDIGP